MAKRNQGSKPKGNNQKKGFKPVIKEEPGKSGRGRRVNYDNTRIDKFEKDIERDSKKPNANDISDFNKNPELLRAAGSIPFANIVGSKFAAIDNPVPGIMIIPWLPCLSYGDSLSALNKAFQQIYSYTVHANSRNYKYEYTDQAMYILAGIEVFSAIAEGARLYGVAKAWAEDNFYYGSDLIRSLGFQPKDILDHLGTIWFDLNNLIMQTKQIWVPNIMPLLTRWIRMNSTIYTDAPGTKSQVYMFVREKYWGLSETASPNGTSLVPALYNMNAGTANESTLQYAQYNKCSFSTSGLTWNAYSQSPQTWAQFKSMIQWMIDQLVASQDRGMIYGDLLQAYGAEKIYAMPEINSAYTIMPEYNSEVLSQIENLTTLVSFNPQAIIQDMDTVDNKNINLRLYQSFSKDSVSKSTTVGNGATQIMNSHVKGQPSPEAIMIMSRFKVSGIYKKMNYQFASKWNLPSGKTIAWDPTTGQYLSGVLQPEETVATAYIPIAAGTEVCLGWWFYVKQFNSASTADDSVFKLVNQYITTGSSGTQNIDPNAYLPIMAFDWHPFIYNYNPTPTGGLNVAQWTIKDAYGDYDNFAEMADAELVKLHATAIYSLLGVPQI